MTSRRQFLASTAAIASAGRTAWGKARQPNVLVIIADEWRAQATSWNGDRNVSTPALDHFAREFRQRRIQPASLLPGASQYHDRSISSDPRSVYQ